MFEDLDPPPDAGDSFLGMYGLTNAWTTWLIGRAAEYAAANAAKFRNGTWESPPRCPRVLKALRFGNETCGKPMTIRPNGWLCNHHKPDGEWDPEWRPLRPKYPPTLDLDVLAHVGDGKMLDRIDPRTGRLTELQV